MMVRLKLTVNEAKTRLRRAPDEPFDFLGYTFGRNWSPGPGRSYIGTRPSKKRLARLVTALRGLTGRRSARPTVQEKVAELNRLLSGWANYFCLGSVSRAYRAMDEQARRRLRQWLRAKYPHQGSGRKRYPDAYLHEVLGLVRLQGRPTVMPDLPHRARPRLYPPRVNGLWPFAPLPSPQRGETPAWASGHGRDEGRGAVREDRAPAHIATGVAGRLGRLVVRRGSGVAVKDAPNALGPDLGLDPLDLPTRQAERLGRRPRCQTPLQRRPPGSATPHPPQHTQDMAT